MDNIYAYCTSLYIHANGVYKHIEIHKYQKGKLCICGKKVKILVNIKKYVKFGIINYLINGVQKYLKQKNLEKYLSQMNFINLQGKIID